MDRLLWLLMALLACSATQGTTARSLSGFVFFGKSAQPANKGSTRSTIVVTKTLGASATAAGQAPCSNNASPVAPLNGGSMWRADLSGAKNIKPGTTGIPAPMPGPSRGTFELTVDEQGQRASWKLQLCDVPQYIASHLHSGSASADYPPPLIPLEPYGKPSNPFAPPTLLPRLCPAITIKGCTYFKEGSFSSADVIPLPGRQPVGGNEVPTVENWPDFLQALAAGKIYINVHSLQFPPGLIRGNLVPVSGSSSSSGSSYPALPSSSGTAGSTMSSSAGR
eukprot:GHRQ01028187.1.p1 GENE.GHRQ01028187.1~~GHRQ01028187.1.p1  ORF type:complete len:280 (+),score=60.91 GHRQ01028187.1:313-1152(+)